MNDYMCFPFVVVQSFSPVWLFVTPWTIACQVPLSVGFSKQEYWFLCPWNSPSKNTGCHSLLQGIFLTQGSNLYLLHWQVDSLPLTTREAQIQLLILACCSLKVFPWKCFSGFSFARGHSLLRTKKEDTGERVIGFGANPSFSTLFKK